MELIDKAALAAEIKRHRKICMYDVDDKHSFGRMMECNDLLVFLNTLEVKDVDLLTHTIIAECCDWLAMNTNLSHDKIEECRNLMLTVKEEQFKIQKGE